MIYHVVGTRPNYIKAQALVKKIQKPQAIIDLMQHRDLNQDDDFSILRYEHNGLLYDMIHEIDYVLPTDQVVVYGDCRCSMVGALVAMESKCALYHVEAGLRCGNLRMMEERIRLAIDEMSDVNFTVNEDFDAPRCIAVGDVMYDLFLEEGIQPGFGEMDVVTLHRRELLYRKDFPEILKRIESRYSGVFVMHPHTDLVMSSKGMRTKLWIVNPKTHREMLEVLARARTVITDSGGVQREACWLGKPLCVIRDKSEWGIPVAGENAERLEPVLWKLESGDGRACERIAEVL